MLFRLKSFLLFLLLIAGFSLAADSPYGVCAHLQRWEYPRAAEELALMKAAGIDRVRFDLDWDAVETAPGKWDFARWDSLVEMAGKANVVILPILAYDVKWATPAWKHLPEWLNYIETVIDRYGTRMPYVEIWNEQNLKSFWRDPDGANYAKLLIPTYRKIKERNPAVTVAYGGTAGIPLDYIEASFKAGAAQAMDVMAIHPYRWRDVPETSLAEDVAALRRLMAKYGAGDKPIWFTETGYPTAPGMGMGAALVPQLLAGLEMNPERTTAVFFGDPDYRYYSENPMTQFSAGVPGLKATRSIRFSEFAALPADAETLLVLPETETFPAEYRLALLDYVRRGGRVLSPAGLPLYFELRKKAKGELETAQVDDRYMPEFHMNWYTFWTRKGTPEKIAKYEHDPKYAAFPLPPFLQAFRFFDGGKLKPGDRFEPVLYGVADGFRGALAGVYHFDSDLKGKIAVCGIFGNGSVGAQGQGELLPRTMLIGFAAGVERIYWYSFRSTEWDNGAEAHFGIVRNNLTPKPAYDAYKTLTAMYPPGSTGLAIRRQDELWVASWRKPDGESVQAVWTPDREVPATCSGTFKTAVNHLGGAASVRKTGETLFEFTAGPGIVYFTGARDFKIL